MRLLLALVLAVVAAVGVDELATRRGMMPPGFADPRRRLLGGLVLGFVFFVGVFVPVTTFDLPRDLDLESVGVFEIFFLQLLLLGSLAAWGGLGFVGVPGLGRRRAAAAWAGQLGLRARDVPAELAVGLAAGVVAWAGVLAAALLAAGVWTRVSGQESLGQEPSHIIVWMAGLPVALRLAVSLAAGVAEELFFRGFLQPRVGILASTALFAGAHLGYGQPFMLFGITLLSLFYAGLVRWRGSVYAAMAAHFLFDAVQLLVIIPLALGAGDTGLPEVVAARPADAP